MKISTKSFTYKLVDQYSSSCPSNNLCDYFWQAVWCWMKAIVLWWVIASFVFMELFTITLFFVEGFSMETIKTAIGVFADILVQGDIIVLNLIGSVLWIVGGVVFLGGNVCGFLCVMCFIIAVILDSLPEKEESEESNSVIKEYYKSWKDKYCKQIDFVDE